MKVTFSYDLDRDAENFIRSAQSVNNPYPTKLHKLYFAEQGNNLDSIKIRLFLERYIKDNKIDLDLALTTIRRQWEGIEQQFLTRTQNIFGEYPFDIDAYLSTNSRCVYNIEQNYFFVYVSSKNASAIIMHELLHFYTWHRFYKELTKGALSAQKYNDIKESLTELLNIEYKDLMGETFDKGYPQHKTSREMVRKIWAHDKDIDRLVRELVATL